MISIPNLFFKYRGVLMAPPLVFALFYFHYETEAELPIWITGTLVFLIGLGIRIWSQEHLHYRLKMERGLTASGPYRYVRNPIYIGNTVMGTGAVILAELPWFVIPTILWYALVYMLVVKWEESRLSGKYDDDYRRYLSEVSRVMIKCTKKGHEKCTTCRDA